MNSVNCVPKYCESCQQIHVLAKPCPVPADECKLCHASMGIRDGCEPTEVCDNCAQAAYSAQSAEVERLSHRVATLERQYGEMGTVAETAVARAEAAASKLSQLQLANEEKARKIAEMIFSWTEGYIPIDLIEELKKDYAPDILAILNGGQQ